MRSASFLATSAVLLLLLFIPLSSVATEINCPGSITETPAVSMEEKHWVVVAISGERPLEQAGIYLGTLSEHGAQVPDLTRTVKKKKTITWRIKRSETDTFWVGCSYAGTTAMLFQKLDASIAECVASYDLLPTGKRQRLSSIECYKFADHQMARKFQR